MDNGDKFAQVILIKMMPKLSVDSLDFKRRPNTPIRLVNGSNQYSGRVEIEYKGSNGTICDNEFDANDARVVCRMLGYNTMSAAVRERAFYGQGSGQIIISNLNCNGNELDISECPTSSYRWNAPYGYCYHSNDVSVQCDTPVRVSGGWTAFSGAVEIYINGSWKSVCHDKFTQNDAQAICSISQKETNYNRQSNYTIHKEGYYMIRNEQSHIGELHCSGTEHDLYFCGSSKWTTQHVECDPSDNVAINCKPKTSVRLMNGRNEVNITADGKHGTSGRVEIEYNNNWGTICDDQFDENDALVICKMMGFSIGHVDRSGKHGIGNGYILIDDLECLGTEEDISECKAREWGTHNCKHPEDISVKCDYIENIDPCSPSEHTRLPNLEMRYVNTLTSSLKTTYNDSKLPPHWYVVGTNVMPDKPPKPGSCGTRNPIYSADALPKLGEEPKFIRAIQVGDEERPYNILVKACSKDDAVFYVYRLGPTVNDQSGYCFGIGSLDPPPSFIAKDVEAIVHTDNFEVSFKCKFEPSDDDLLYQVYWYIEGNNQQTLTKQHYNKSNLHELHLTETDFNKLDIGLGVYISCLVRAFKTTDGQPGPSSARSEPYFAGIEVLTSTITLRSGETRSIELINYMPIVCNKTFNDNPEICNVVLEHMTPDDNACSNSLAYSDRQCSTILYNTSYLQTTIINITTSATDMYGVYGHFKVNLVVSPNRLNYKRFWSSAYKLPTIDVFVQPEADRSWRGKLCTAQNDPHMHTFDGRHYEHHEANGEYILYQHNLFENVQVQHKIASCVGLNGTAKCNCGVGVRSGRDVYVINVCDRLLDIGFKRCQDESLTVKKNNDFTYTIYLSYGTAIRARIDNQPWMGDEGGKVVDITISPTMYDHEGKSSGLCGTITSNKEDDFVLRNRSYGALNESDRQMFINSWKVKETESLFSENVYHMQLQPWHFPSCSCNPGKAANDTTTCDRTLSDCTPGMTSGQHSCGGVSAMRSVRSISTPLGIPVVMQTDHYSTIDRPRLIKKRNANLPLPGTMTPKEICTNYFKDLAAFALCNKIPATNTNISTENCEMDIQLTNSTAWLNISGQSMQDVCILEIHRNSSVRQAAMESAKNNSVLPEHAPHSIVTDAPVHLQEIQEIENIVKKIKDVSCLNNCSGNGHCASGTCLCMDGYGAADCSVDTKKPPRLVDIIHKGLCDEKDGNDCSYIYVFGEIFTATNLTCRLQKFTMKEGETREMHNIQSYIKGIHDSLIEAICPIENLRLKRSSGTSGLSPADFVYGFQVSMSNDGVHFGNETKDVYIFNSSCQTYSNTTKGMIFNIKAGFCHIEGRCISNGSLSVSQTMICDTDYSKFSWRILPSTTKLPSTTQATQSSSMKGSCTHGVCVCNTGWTGTLCENDIDECQGINTDICSSDSNTACQNIPGSFECLCLRGFVNTTGECKRSEVIDPRSLVEHKVNSNRNLQAFTIEIEIDMHVNSTTNINTSTTYKRFADAANISLSNVYQRTLGIAFKEVVILSLKTGSLFIEHAVITTKNEFSVTALSHVIAEWSTGGHIEMFNLTYSVKKITTEKGSVGEGDLLLCMSYTSIHPCAKDESCVIDNEKPVCKKQEVSSDNSKLVTIISSSVGVVLELVICILIGCLCRRRTDRNKRLDNRNKSAQENPYHEFNSTEMLQRPRKTVEDDNCLSPPDPSVDNRSCKSGGTYYQSDDGYMYYFGKQ